MNDFVKAGRIAAEAREYARKEIKEGVNIYEYVVKVEEMILESADGLAFPVNISINEYAAHDTADYESDEVFKKGEVVKVDIGAQVNGYIGDTAFTKEISTNKYNDLIKASEEALNKALKIVKPGVKVREIGMVINEVISGCGFNPITNLGGHGLGEYDLHSSLFIPNYDNNNNTRLEDGEMIAIEPFATTGQGRVVNSKKVKIYALKNLKPVRSRRSREILKFVQDEFKTLPFAKHHLLKEFSKATVKLGLKELTKHDVIHEYPLLKEKSEGIVSQAEHSLLVKDEPVITTII